MRNFMNKTFLKRLPFFILVLLACYATLYFLSEGNISVPDASKYRNNLYIFVFYILPLIMLFNFFYLFSCLVKNAISIIVISLLLGGLGPLWLMYSIHSSTDSLAGMALLLLITTYSMASLFAFVILMLAQMIRNRVKSR